MPLFEGHKDSGIQRLFIELPDNQKNRVLWKWPDQQIPKHSLVNVDADYQAVFTNLGKVIGTMGPGRWPLDEGASLAFGWLVDRLTGDAYYDAEIYYVTTRDITNQHFGGPVDNLTDGPTGLVVTLRVFGQFAYHVTDPVALLTKMTGTDGVEDFDGQISAWVQTQVQAAIRTVLPDLVSTHGVLAMGQLQDATATSALAKANVSLVPYGLAVTAFGELNVNLPDDDAAQLKKLAAAKAYTAVAGSFDSAVRAEATLDIAQGVADGNVGATPAVVAGMLMGITPPPPPPPSAPVPTPVPTPAPAAVPTPADSSAPEVRFCPSCGTKVVPDAKFCVSCGAALTVGT